LTTTTTTTTTTQTHRCRIVMVHPAHAVRHAHHTTPHHTTPHHARTHARSYPVPPMEETHARTEVIIGNWMAARGNRDKVRARVRAHVRVHACACVGAWVWLPRLGTLHTRMPRGTHHTRCVARALHHDTPGTGSTTTNAARCGCAPPGADCDQGGVLHARL
jgi:hypothetical protein